MLCLFFYANPAFKIRNALNTIISSKNDLEINEKNFIKEYVNLIINQGYHLNKESSTKYSATITKERLNQLKNIAREIFAEMGQISAQLQIQNLGMK